jgi:preprotein translocase subunit Sec63
MFNHLISEKGENVKIKKATYNTIENLNQIKTLDNFKIMDYVGREKKRQLCEFRRKLSHHEDMN